MRYVKNVDIRDATEYFIAHGCNCQGVMGSGVALAIKNKWPKAFTQYVDDVNNSRVELGHCSFVDVSEDENPKYILNLLTQDKFGTDQRHVNYAAIVTALEHAISIAYLDYGILIPEIAIPKIGAGLGGGDWDIIETILLDFEELYNVEFVVYYFM